MRNLKKLALMLAMAVVTVGTAHATCYERVGGGWTCTGTAAGGGEYILVCDRFGNCYRVR